MKTTQPRVTPTSSLHVSRKFYNELLTRIDNILQALFNDAAPAYFESAKRMIDSYLADQLDSIPQGDIIPEVKIIFVTLKTEIDRARQRSLRARTAARTRRAVRPQISTTDSPSPATESIPKPVATPSPESAAPSSTALTTPTQEAPIDSNAPASPTTPASETPAVPTPPHVIKNIPNSCPGPKRHPSLKWKPANTRPKQHSKHPYTHFKPARKH